MIFKQKFLLVLTALFLTQVTYAKQGFADSYTTMNNGFFQYSEISDFSLTDVKINFNSGHISIITQNDGEKIITKKMKFDPSVYNIPFNTKSISFQSSQTNIETIFDTNYRTNKFNNKTLLDAGVSIKSSDCGSTAGRLLDLANQMIHEGQTTGNDALVAFGRVLRDIAIDMFQNCVLQ